MTTLTWHAVTVRDISALQDAYLLLRVEHSGLFRHQPGQHCVFKLRDETHEHLYSFSIASRQRADHHLEFCIATQPESRLARLLKSIKAGDTLMMSEAVGTFLLPERNGEPYVFIAGGSGIAPIRAMIQELLFRGVTETVHLLYGCRDASNIPYLAEIQSWKTSPRFKIWITADRAEGSPIPRGRVTDFIGEAKIEGARYVLCGPAPMVDACYKELGSRGVSSRSIFSEKYGPA